MRFIAVLTLLLITAASVHSQSEKCYQTVAVNCTDSIVDYLTLNEKKNLFRLQITLQRMRTELSECHARSEADSLHRQRLTITIAELQQAVELYRSSHTYNEQAIAELQGLIRFYKKQIRGIKAKGWIGGTFGGIAAFGAGVGTAFIIIKTL